MFILTATIHRRRLAAGLLALTVLCGGVWGLSETLSAPGEAVSALGGVTRLRNNEDRVAYLAGFGWEVTGEPVSVEELLVPEEFDESYDDYLALQSSQGFDLTACAGKRLKRYTYEITNYPSGETGVLVSLLLFRSAVVGGEVYTTSLDGFMHGLAMPE